MPIEAPTYRFTTEEFHKLGEVGILDEDDRIELLNGELVIMSPVGYRHARAVISLNSFFVKHSKDRYLVSPQNPVVLADVSEPQPDLALVRDSPETFNETNPRPQDIFLLIEVADSSLGYDRGPKLRAYARAGISEFWIVNLSEGVIETFREPVGEAYQQVERFRPKTTVSPLAFPDLVVSVSEMIP